MVKVRDLGLKKEQRPTNEEREQNVGMFGRGVGDTDAKGNLLDGARSTF